MRLALLVAVAATLGCAGRTIDPERPDHGNIHVALAKAKPIVDRDKRTKPRPAIVLVERRGVRALAPDSGKELWFLPLRVTGHMVASRYTLIVPVRGHRLVAVDRLSGTVKWTTKLPAEALTGVSIAEPFVVASLAGGKGKRRSRVVGISTHDGAIRWSRKSTERFGVPAARGRSVFVPLGESRVLALRTATGREVARVRPGTSVDRAQLSGQNLVAADGNAFVDLGAARHRVRSLKDAYAEAFAPVRGLDPGHGEGERLSWWVRVPQDGSAPREAIMLSRRAVVAVRMNPKGRAIETHWLHWSQDKREFVGMHVARDVVSLVREDGAILRLSTADGSEQDAIAGGEDVRGALFLDMTSDDRPLRLRRPKEDQVVASARDLLSDEDPRLLPAQQLVADVLWRDDQPAHREIVVALAAGDLRSGAAAADEHLRGHAAELTATPWGESSGDSIESLIADLAVKPSFLKGEQPPALGTLARRAVRQGDAQVVPHLVSHLLDPATAAGDLVEVARALREIDSPKAVEGVAEFVIAYHADPDVVYESGAMEHAVAFLVARASDSANGGDGGMGRLSALKARQALSQVLQDPFTDPQLAATIRDRAPETSFLADGPAASEDPHESAGQPPGTLPTPDL